MNGVGKGYSCSADGGLLHPLLFASKQSKGHGYDLDKIWNQKQLYYEGI